MPQAAYVSDIIDTAEGQNACDTACKKVLALKEIASRILKGVVSEYKDCTPEEIMSFISNAQISNTPVDADRLPPVIHTDNSEDITISEGNRFYDIKFTAKAPETDGESITLIINIEAQKNYNPGYSLLKRGIYYCSRLISSQYGSVFTGSDYSSLQKVYSIWICTNPDAAHRNTITKYSLTPDSLYGTPAFETESDRQAEHRNYDMMTLVMICLDGFRTGSDSENDVIKLLSTLFSPNMGAAEKKQVLQNSYDIKMTTQVNKEVENMCNLSQGFLEHGLAKGLAQGREQGLAQGREQGLAHIINTMLSDGRSPEEIASILHISVEKVNELKEMH